MKGPGLRIDLDVRRLWQCPKCGRQVRTEGDVVNQRCNCTSDGEWMTLIEPKRKRRPLQPLVIPDSWEADELAGPEEAKPPGGAGGDGTDAGDVPPPAGEGI